MLNGHIYYRRDKYKTNTYWSCIRKGECRATAVTTTDQNNVLVKKEGKHDHAPNQEAVGAERIKARIKRKAVEHPEVTPAQLLRTELPGVSSGIISQLPERENLKKSIRTARRKDMPNNPLSLTELGEIPAR